MRPLCITISVSPLSFIVNQSGGNIIKLLLVLAIGDDSSVVKRISPLVRSLQRNSRIMHE